MLFPPTFSIKFYKIVNYYLKRSIYNEISIEYTLKQNSIAKQSVEIYV